MSLPILNVVNEPVAADLVRFFHRTELHFSEHLGEQTQLDIGAAIVNPRMPDVVPANAVLDAALPPGMSPRQAVELAQAHFAAADSICRRWVVNPSAPAERTRPLAEHLSEEWRCRPVDIFHLSRIKPAARRAEGLTVIPARASFRHAQELAEEMAGQAAGQPPADAVMLHLDDVQWEALLALRQGRAVATVGVLTAGEIGRIDQLYVSPGHRRQGIGQTMMSRALEVCARALLRHVFVPVPPDSPALTGLTTAFGFEKIGRMISYERPEA